MEDPRRVVETAVSHAPIGPGERVLALVSGGPDSTCLLHVLAGVFGSSRLGALHVNYGLRPEAEADEIFCRGLCERLGVKFAAERVDLGPGNLQAAARDSRYGLARDIARGQKYDVIATGHTASDQVETVLYRLAASPGRRALLGMRPRQAQLVRPLLAVNRDQVLAYLKTLGLEFREDPTNEDLRFARNRIRHRVIPELERIHPAAVHNVLSTRDQLEDEADVLDQRVEEAMREAGAGGEANAVEASGLAGLASALRRLVLRTLAERAAGAPVTLSADQVDELLKLAARGGTHSLDLGGVRAICEYGVVRFSVSENEGSPPIEPVTLSVPGGCRFGEWDLSGELVEASLEGEGDRDVATLDAEKTGMQLIVRAWREGDRMRPLGLKGSKSLQDLFTDCKIPRNLRSRLPVVEANSRIAWVAGVAVSDEFKLTSSTSRAVRLRATLRR